MYEGGKGMFESCDIRGHSEAGVAVASEGLSVCKYLHVETINFWG